MDVAMLRELVAAVKDVGFPVATAGALAFWTWYQDREARKERAAQHTAFVEALQGIVAGGAELRGAVGDVDDKVTASHGLLERLLERRP